MERREKALTSIADRRGLAWARYYPGMYVVARDGAELGDVRAARRTGRRRDRWMAATTTAPLHWHGPYPTLAAAAAALNDLVNGPAIGGED